MRMRIALGRMTLLLAVFLLAGLLSGCAGDGDTGEQSAVESTRQPEEGEAPPPEGGAVATAGEAPPPLAEATEAPGEVPVAARIPEERLLVVEWPQTIRQGDSDTIRLTLEVDEAGRITPTALIEGHEVLGSPVEIPNLYETHNVVAEARLDLAGMEIVPGAEISESLRPGQPVNFFWSVRPGEPGDYRGTLWLHLRFIPIEPGGQEERIALTAQQIEIRAVNLLGLGGTPARLLGVAGTLAGSLLGLDNIASWLWGIIRKNRGNRQQNA